MTRALSFAAFLMVFAPALSQAQRQSHPILEATSIENEYLQVSRIALPAATSVSFKNTGHVYLLIVLRPPLLTDASDDGPPRVLSHTGVWMLEQGHSHQLVNNNDVQFSDLLVELRKNPGLVSCSNGKNCFWSIRDWRDPQPNLLSEHVTVFMISVPWKPEPQSRIAPTRKVLVAGKPRDAGEPIWMSSSSDVTDPEPANPENSIANALGRAKIESPPTFFESLFTTILSAAVRGCVR